MIPKLPPDMLKVMQLTKDGHLAEATRLIQRLLHGRSREAAAASPERHSASTLAPITIDAVAERLPDDGAARERTATDATAKAPEAIREAAAHAPAGTSDPAPSDATRGLRAVLGRLSQTVKQRPDAPAPAVPDGAEFLARTHTGAAGSRDYKLYVPSGYRGEPLPLVVMLHGCTQSAEDFATGTRMNEIAEARGLLVAYPIQSKTANATKCWNWFKPGDQTREGGEPSLIAGIVGDISGAYRVDRSQVYVAGLSAGGAAAAIVGATYPELFAAIGVHSGLPVGAATDLSSALAAMRQGRAGRASLPRAVPVIVLHGDRDTTVHPSNGDHVVEQFRSSQTTQLRTVLDRGETAAGRAYSRTCHLDAEGRAQIETWTLHGSGHAWSGGSPAGSFTDPQGPDASRAMVDFFLGHRAMCAAL